MDEYISEDMGEQSCDMLVVKGDVCGDDGKCCIACAGTWAYMSGGGSSGPGKLGCTDENGFVRLSALGRRLLAFLRVAALESLCERPIPRCMR